MAASESKRAVVLAAGRGARMGELTEQVPKPMLPLDGKPLLEHVLGSLRQADFGEVLLVTGYRREIIEQRFPGYPMRVQEPQDGTGSATLLGREFTGDGGFLLTFGDILVGPDCYGGIWRRLVEDPRAFGVCGVRFVDDPSEGAAVYEREGVVTRIVEKPPPGASSTNWNSAGLYAFRPAIYEALARLKKSPRGEYELTSAVSEMVEGGGRLLLYAIEGDWGHVTRPEDVA
jgi:dTDP-glucose pyrophosphorylase